MLKINNMNDHYINENELQNNQVAVILNDRLNDTSINFYDRLDSYNDYKGFTQNKRGIFKAWDELLTIFNETTTFSEVMEFLDQHKLKTHTYCGMD